MPSISAWWVFEIRAKPPSSSPSTIHTSHSGLERSSCWEKIRPVSPGAVGPSRAAGSAVWRTWYSRLKLGSSTHSGPAGPGGGTASLWR